MKLYIRFLLFIIVLACVAPFLIKGQDGRPLMTLDDLSFSRLSVPDISAPLDRSIDAADDQEEDSRTTTVFKWQDEDGMWHFSDSKMEGSEALVIEKNANLVHFEKPPEPEEPVEDPEKDAAGGDKAAKLDAEDNPYEQLPELIDQAKGVKELLETRQKQQEQAIKDIVK